MTIALVAYITLCALFCVAGHFFMKGEKPSKPIHYPKCACKRKKESHGL